MRKLSDADRKIWEQATKHVTPLGSNPSPQHLPKISISNIRQNVYDPRIDLHGLTIQDAYTVVLDHITNGALLGYRKLTIISGRSGQINIELPRWAERHSAVRSVDSINGGGAWEICLKRRDT